jgi:hypothetical protein
MPDWFETLFGFRETSYAQTQAHFSATGTTLTSRANGREFGIGGFETPTLADLRATARGKRPGRLEVTHEIVGDVLTLHARPENAGALFQVASQFNCLEFPGPEVVPECGVTGYVHDHTQGPACALAAGAATVYRNYLVPVAGVPGQTTDRQLNNLDALQARLGRAPDGGSFFEVRNGYTFATAPKLRALRTALDRHDRETLLGAVKIGIQRCVQVTFADRFVEPASPAHVSQAFCSALSCGYTDVPLELWQPLATLVLDASYEATLLAAAVDAAESGGSGKVWLTFLGGGAFQNDRDWIATAIGRALARCADADLDVRVAHFRRLDERMRARIEAAAAQAVR